MKNIFLLLVLVLSAFQFKAQDAKSKYSISVLDKQNQVQLLKNNKPVLIIESIQFNFVPPVSIKIKEQSANKMVVELFYKNVPAVGKVETKNDFTVDLNIDKIDNGYHVYAHPAWARHITIKLKDLGEHFFGIRENLIPDNNKSPDLRGSIQSFDVDGESSRYYENYASVWSAFYFCNLGYASFINTFAKGEYKFAMNGKTEIYHETGNLDWYLFTGSNGDEIISSYYKIIGAPKFVPAWACGVTIWRDENKGGKDEILDDAKKLTDLKIPITAFFVDRPYSNGNSGWSKMDFSPAFNNPQQWISELNKKFNLQFMSWVAPCSFGDNFPGTLPGYYSYFDLSNPESVSEFSKRLNENQYVFGVKGHKMDRADEHFPVSELWKDNTPEWERRNKYIFLYAKVVDSILTAKWGKDNFNFARAAMHGSQKYLGAVWGGDSRASWDGMASNLANAIRCGFMGFSNWGSDVGGYLGNNGFEPEKLFSRWLQFGSWSGLFEIKLDGAGGKGNDRAPWRYGEKLQNIFRTACEERLQLAPYIYSQLNTAKTNGVLMKPLGYSYSNDTNTFSIWDEYLFGQSFLIAQVYNDNLSRKIYLPEGNWYDWYAPSKTYSGKKYYDYRLSDAHLPVFVKENSLFVTGENWLKGNSVIWEKESAPVLIVHAFPGSSNFSDSFEYIDHYDNDNSKIITIEQKGKRIELDIPSLGLEGKVIIHNLVPIGSVTLNGKTEGATIDRQNKNVIVTFQKLRSHKIIVNR